MKKRKGIFKMLRKLNNERGSLLVLGYFVIVVMLGLGASFMLMSANEALVSERQKLSTVAFHIAEAGVERALKDLRLDFVNAVGTPSWSDGTINTYAIGPDTANYYTIPYADNTINNGTYVVQLKNIAAATGDVWVKSVGTVSGVSHTIEIYTRMVSVSPWDYAIFAGSGASGTMINGNVDIRGSVLVLGNNLNPGDYAMDLGGTAQLVGNNYTGMDPTLTAKVPALPTVVHNGETVSTLNGVLRVKKGLVGLSGSATLGEPNVAGNSVKETISGSYVSNGFGGNQGTANVYSDNGSSNPYDLGEAVRFPSLSDPSSENPSLSHQQYFRSTALVLTNQLSSISPTSTFSYTDGTNSISMAGGVLSITGKVYIDGNNSVTFDKAGSNKTITYSGKGSLLVTGSVNVNTNLITNGNNSFPNNNMGIMTPNTITFNEAQIDAMGMYYAENQIVATKQTDIIGSIVSNYFNMGTNVPAIYQVPTASNNMPPGMIGSGTRWYMVVAWMES